MTETSELRDANVQKAKMAQFPRKKKGTFERTAARAKDRNKYRKDFKRTPKQ